MLALRVRADGVGGGYQIQHRVGHPQRHSRVPALVAAGPQAPDEVRQQAAHAPVAQHAHAKHVFGTRQMASQQAIADAQHQTPCGHGQSHLVRQRARAQGEIAGEEPCFALALPVVARALELHHEKIGCLRRPRDLRERVPDRRRLRADFRNPQSAELGADEGCAEGGQIERLRNDRRERTARDLVPVLEPLARVPAVRGERLKRDHRRAGARASCMPEGMPTNLSLHAGRGSVTWAGRPGRRAAAGVPGESHNRESTLSRAR